MNNETIRLWYVIDPKGVSSILTTWDRAKTAIARHREFIESRRGPGQLKQVDVPSSDWYSGKIELSNIARCPNAEAICHV
jgi:hypothetical protein